MIPPHTNGVKTKFNTEQPQRMNPHQKYVSCKRGEDQPINHGCRLCSRNTTFENYKSWAAKYLLAQHIFSHKAYHIYNEHGKRFSIDVSLSGEYSASRWMPVLSNEWGWLAQENYAGVKSIDTIEFIPHKDVPQEKKIIYASFVCNHRPLKDEKWRIRLVVGGYKLTYDSDLGSQA